MSARPVPMANSVPSPTPAPRSTPVPPARPMRRFTLHRLWAIVLKEFIQMKRDRVTFAMMAGIPLMQLLLFGFAINSDPRHLPAALRAAEADASVKAALDSEAKELKLE